MTENKMEENKNNQKNEQNNNPPNTEPKSEIDILKEQLTKSEKDSSNQPSPKTSAGKASSPLKELEEKLAKCEKEREEYLNGWKRAKADYINLQKDGMKRIEEILKFGNEELIKELLPVLDSFELSIIATKDPETKKGIEIIYSQLEKILNLNGLEKIKALGEKFNPSLHEAITQEESDKESGTILEETIKGWKLNGKVIRPTKVKIAK